MNMMYVLSTVFRCNCILYCFRDITTCFWINSLRDNTERTTHQGHLMSISVCMQQ